MAVQARAIGTDIQALERRIHQHERALTTLRLTLAQAQRQDAGNDDRRPAARRRPGAITTSCR